MTRSGFPRVRVDVSPLGVWVIGALSTLVLVFMMIIGVQVWAGVPSGHMGSRVFIAVWFVAAVAMYLNGLRLLIRRHFFWRAGAVPRLWTPLLTIRPPASDDLRVPRQD